MEMGLRAADTWWSCMSRPAQIRGRSSRPTQRGNANALSAVVKVGNS